MPYQVAIDWISGRIYKIKDQSMMLSADYIILAHPEPI